MAKRGPKRKDRKRYPCGKLVPVERPIMPTAELIAKRLARFAIAGVTELKDLNLAESWLGVCYAAEVISEEQYQAGVKYHGLYKVLFPQGFPGSSLDADLIQDGQPFEPIDDDGVGDIDLAWKATERILAAHGRRAHNLVKNICVYNRFERFMDVSSRRSPEAWRADRTDKTLFVTCLEALAAAYRPVALKMAA